MRKVKQLLPIGSVVRLSGAKKDLMICGICQTQRDNGKEFDYIGVLWPEGSLGNKTNVLFDHGDIENIAFTGYDGPERQAFIDRLEAFYAAKQ